MLREIGRWRVIHGAWVAAACAIVAAHAFGQGVDAEAKQSVLGPGLYVYQTRTRSSTCGDAEPDGYVLSYFAAIDGVPGRTTMTMRLTNSRHFVDWTLTVKENKQLLGESRMGSAPNDPETRIALKLEGDRWKGTGARHYSGQLAGKPARCRVDYDALIRRIDL